MQWRCVLSVVACLSLSTAPLWAAPPTTSKPKLLLDVRADDKMRQILGLTQKLCEEIEGGITTLAQRAEKRQLKQVTPQQVGKIEVQLTQLERMVAQLQLGGEPASADAKLRHDQFYKGFTELKRAYESSPGASTAIANMMGPLQRQTEQRNKLVPKIQKLLNEKKYVEAADQIMPVVDELESVGIWFNSDERPYRPTIIPVSGPAYREAFRVLHDQVGEKLKADFQATWPDFAGLTQQVDAAAQSIGKDGTAAWDGQAVPGPEFVSKAIQRWQEMHLAAERGVALSFAAGSALASPTGAYSTGPQAGGPSTGSPLVVQQQKFATAIGQGIGHVVSAAAQRATAADAAALHAQYTLAVAPLASLTDDSTLQAQLSSSLDKLAAKNPNLLADVTAYRLVIDDRLRWRHRAAEAAARSRRKEFVPLATSIGPLVSRDAENALLAVPRTPVGAYSLAKPVPEVLAAAQAIKGKLVAVSDVRAPRSEGKLSISARSGGSYARVPRPDVQAVAARLPADMLVDDAHLPLTLAVARALEAARAGDAEEVGGEVMALAMEGLMPRMTAANPADFSFAPLMAWPTNMAPYETNHVLVRLDVQSRWIRTSYAFIELPQSEKAATPAQ